MCPSRSQTSPSTVITQISPLFVTSRIALEFTFSLLESHTQDKSESAVQESKENEMGNYVSTAEATQSSIPGTLDTARASRSRRSSVASGTSSVDSSSSAEQAIRSSAAATSSSPSSSPSQGCADPACEVDPLSRTFPKPTEDVNLDEMLARKPLKWTLGHYVKEAPSREPSKPVEDKDRLAQDMEAKKKEMLAAKEEILRLSAGK